MTTANEALFAMAGAIQSAFKTPEQWAIRHEVAWYVSRCEMAGFCNTDEMRRQCAERYIKGKRRVSPPGTTKRKRQARETRKILANIPPELLVAIEQAKQTPAWAQYQGGNAKAINAVIGPLIKQFKVPFDVIKSILEN
jgi:hypothetical protein